jgi:hypothetical protein
LLQLFLDEFSSEHEALRAAEKRMKEIQETLERLK